MSKTKTYILFTVVNKVSFKFSNKSVFNVKLACDQKFKTLKIKFLSYYNNCYIVWWFFKLDIQLYLTEYYSGKFKILLKSICLL